MNAMEEDLGFYDFKPVPLYCGCHWSITHIRSSELLVTSSLSMNSFVQLFPHDYLINIKQNTSKQNLKTSPLIPNVLGRIPEMFFLRMGKLKNLSIENVRETK